MFGCWWVVPGAVGALDVITLIPHWIRFGATLLLVVAGCYGYVALHAVTLHGGIVGWCYSRRLLVIYVDLLPRLIASTRYVVVGWTHYARWLRCPVWCDSRFGQVNTALLLIWPLTLRYPDSRRCYLLLRYLLVLIVGWLRC